MDVIADIQKQVRDCRTEPVLYRGLVLTWAGYDEIVGGVERVVPSQCGQRNCPPGYTGSKCQNLEIDKVLYGLPSSPFCPSLLLIKFFTYFLTSWRRSFKK